MQHVVRSYDSHFAALNDPAKSDAPVQSSADASGKEVGKECSNLVVLLSELYNFQVISCVLMYDVIHALLVGDLTEFKVELLLKVARSMFFISWCMDVIVLTPRVLLRFRSAAQAG